MDAVSHRGVNPSIGEASLSLGSGSHLEKMGREASMGSGAQLERLGEADHESASNIAIAGTSIAGSIASSGRHAYHRYDDGLLHWY